MRIHAHKTASIGFFQATHFCITIALLFACAESPAKHPLTAAPTATDEIQPFDISLVTPTSSTERELLQGIKEIQATYGAESGKVLPELDRLEEVLKADPSRREQYRQVLFYDLVSRSRVYGSRHPSVAEHLHSLGNLYLSEDDIASARQVLEKSLSICLEARGEDDICAAGNFNSMAYVEKQSGDYEKAVDLYKKSDAIWSRLQGVCSDPSLSVKYNLAIAYEHLNKNDEVIKTLESCIGKIEENKEGEARTLKITSRLAQAYERGESFEKSIISRQKSVEAARLAYGGRSVEVADQLNGLAVIYIKLGKYELAESAINEGLDIFEKLDLQDSAEYVNTLNAKAGLYKNMGHYEKSLEIYALCLSRLEKQSPQDHEVLAAVLSSVSGLHSMLGRHELAKEMVERSIAIREQAYGGDSSALNSSLVNLAFIQLRGGDVDAAEKRFIEILAKVKTPAGAREVLWRCQYGLFQVNTIRKKSVLAILWGKEAVNTIQELRHELGALPDNFQESFTEKKQHVFNAVSDVLIEAGRLVEAQLILQMLKEDELHRLVSRSHLDDPRVTRVELIDTELERLSAYQEIQQKQMSLFAERTNLEQKQKHENLSKKDETRIKQLDEELSRKIPETKQGILLALEADTESIPTSGLLTNGSLRSRGIIVPGQQGQARLQSALSSVGDGLSNHVVALQYVLFNQSLSILLSSSGRAPVAYQVRIDKEFLRRKIFALRDMIGNPRSSELMVRAELKELHSILIEPVANEVTKRGADTLVLLPSDVIRYVPFSALYDGEKYLVEKYALTLFNEAIQKPANGTSNDKWRLVAMGLTRSVEDFPALPSVREELESITGVEGVGGDLYLNEAFTRLRLVGALNSNYNALHLASHFKFVAGRPELSRLYLGDLSTLSLDEIARQNLRFDRFKLVTFSACDSGLGGDAEEDGVAMDSLGALVQYQGAQSVMAALWKVDDYNTAELMQDFYRAMGHEKTGRSKALRAAQLQFIKQTSAKQSHPYYWAPFVMMGDWL